MRDNRKTMDFFRPVRSTDPLVSRPLPKPGPTVIRREKITSLPPTLRESPNAEKERDPYKIEKAPVYSSSVVFEEVTLKKLPEKPKTSSVKKSASPSVVKNEFSDDDWLSSLKSEGFFSSDEEEEKADEPIKLGKELKRKPLYTFTGESPFLKSVKVEKRPLSRSVPKKAPPVFEPEPSRPAPVKQKIKSPSSASDVSEKKHGVPFSVTVILTIILGISAGIAVFLLIS